MSIYPYKFLCRDSNEPYFIPFFWNIHPAEQDLYDDWIDSLNEDIKSVGFDYPKGIRDCSSKTQFEPHQYSPFYTRYCLGMIYETLEDAIKGAKDFADAFDMDGCVKITEAPDGGYELFGTGKLVKLV